MRNAVQEYILAQMDEKTKVNELYGYLQSKSAGKADKICVFGAGQKGKELFTELRKRLIDIYCFTDNNPDNYGYLLEGKYCIPLSYLKKEKAEVLMIIAVQSKKAGSEISSQLYKEGFVHIMLLDELSQIFADVQGVRWMEQIYGAKDADVSEQPNQELLARMNQLVFDLCKYYDGRKTEKD